MDRRPPLRATRFALCVLCGFALGQLAIPGPVAAEPACPEGTVLRRSAPETAPVAWCESADGLREGPAETLHPDGAVEWTGTYRADRRHGLWRRFDPDGTEIAREHWWFGVGGREVEDPEPVCPEGSHRIRIGRVNGHLQDRCLGLDAAGNPIREGPTFSFTGRGSGGEGPLWLSEAAEYRNGERHGLRRRWHAPGVLALEEHWERGSLEGPSRTWSSDGTLREECTFRGGRPDGLRTYRRPDGTPRWEAVYENGRPVEVTGDRTVAGQPCPEDALPMTSDDGLRSWCERGVRWPERHGAYAVRNAAGEIVERGLYEDGRKVEIWEAPPGTDPVAGRRTVQGRVLFAGRRLSDFSRLEPTFWFRDEEEGVQVRPEAVYEDGHFAVYGLPPGYYFMGLGVDAEPSNPSSYPGDFKAHTRFHVRDGEVTEHDVHLQQVIRLLAPADNGDEMEGWDLPCAEKSAVEAPLRFAWEPVEVPDGEVVYCFHVRRVACEPFRTLDTVAEGRGSATEVVLELPPSQPGEIFLFEVHAFHGGRQIGGLMTHGHGGHGWDWRFRVR